MNAQKAREAEEGKVREKARRIWNHGIPIAGTKGEAYFRNRGIMVDLPECLRWRADLLHTSGRWLSAVVADVQPTGGIHRTFFEKTGERLTNNAKMMLGPCRGGAVRLFAGLGPLLVGEGIESTLSAYQLLNKPTARAWAALSTSGIKGLILPSVATYLIIAPDGDAPGRDAANELAKRAHAANWNVSIMDPGDGLDWNDVLQNEGVAA